MPHDPSTPVRPTGPAASVRTAVVWEVLSAALAEADPHGRGLDVVDAGGGTGGFAVPLAEAGHRVTVVDPSPDSLAALARRVAERGLEGRVTGVQGDLSELARPRPARQLRPAAVPQRAGGRRRPGRRPRRRSPQRSAAAGGSACWPPTATLLSSPVRWPGTPRRRRTPSPTPPDGSARPTARTGGSPLSRCPTWSPRPGWSSSSCTASASSATWCPAPRSTASPVPWPRCSRWSGPCPAGCRSATSRPSSTCSPCAAEPAVSRP